MRFFYKPLTQESLAFTKVQIPVISHSKWWSLKNETIVVKCEYFFSKWKCQSWKFCFYQVDLEVSTFSVNISNTNWSMVDTVPHLKALKTIFWIVC